MFATSVKLYLSTIKFLSNPIYTDRLKKLKLSLWSDQQMCQGISGFYQCVPDVATTRFDMWLPSSGGRRCLVSYSGNVCGPCIVASCPRHCLSSLYGSDDPLKKAATCRNMSGIKFGTLIKSTGSLTHLLVISRPYCKMLGPTVKKLSYFVCFFFFFLGGGVFPGRQIKFCRRFGTLCQVHLQRLDDAGEIPKRKHTWLRTRRKFEIQNKLSYV
jgi:hypothetical protein